MRSRVLMKGQRQLEWPGRGKAATAGAVGAVAVAAVASQGPRARLQPDDLDPAASGSSVISGGGSKHGTAAAAGGGVGAHRPGLWMRRYISIGNSTVAGQNPSAPMSPTKLWREVGRVRQEH